MAYKNKSSISQMSEITTLSIQIKIKSDKIIEIVNPDMQGFLPLPLFIKLVGAISEVEKSWNSEMLAIQESTVSCKQ